MHPIHLHTHESRQALGEAAGRHAADVLNRAVRESGRARVMLAAAPSQQETLAALAASDVDFSRVDCFHMDDYLGLPAGAPQGFGNWLERHFVARARPRRFARIDTAAVPQRAADEYAEAMGAEPFDLTLCGLGVNGHLAFNDPPADFADPVAVKVVTLDAVSRRQQVDEGHFACLDDVPEQALTVTIPRLLSAGCVIASVPGRAKRDAVAQTLAHDLDPRFPGTALKTHPDAHLYVDEESDPDD
ncbi:6-phosphogluconolactonase [Krasilnikoviella flava]|uniref:Glucosamine-6-phosphate deaminase n=1 Tax=Krasilnikoviella flava TaxID=526729 RepID=A0A1T5L4D2_9MICO|nr:6-phosphogluconolactonase [Krasilnikoviella flava]SKC70916.1 glucosamine-6-phosphate deaminase [Krasilnikoviella flava]